MINTSFFSSLSIKSRVVILATLPVVLLTLLLSSYMISNKLDQERRTLAETSQSIISYLSAGAEFGMFSRNTGALASLSKPAFKNSDIHDVLFVDNQGQLIYQAGDTKVTSIPINTKSPNSALEPQHLSPHRWFIQSPVFLVGIQVDDFEDSNGAESPQSIGWVVLIVDEQQMFSRQKEIIFQGVMITLFGLLITLWLALRIGKSITQPIQAITDTIEQLRQEKFDARVTVDSHGELGELQKGINNLATRVQDTRLRLEDEITNATQSLRTALKDLEYKNVDLDTAKQKAEAANRAKDQFLARMSHELRTPLTSVIGFSQLLQKTPLNNQQLEYSGIVQKTSSMLLNLIDDVLSFSKLQSDAISIEKIRFNLDECLSDVMEMQTPTAAEKGIQVYFTPSHNMPDSLLGDPTRIRQIMTNLIGNAIKFTEQGHVSVHVRCKIDFDEADLTISVKDTGIGISELQIAYLFEPFTQADTTITRRFGGSGLGLVISKHLAQLMGGDITLESCSKTGTCVSLSLRLPVLETEHPRINLSKSKILIFEQSTPSSDSLSAWANYLKASCKKVSTAKEMFVALSTTNDYDSMIVNLRSEQSEQYYLQLLRLIRRHFKGSLLLVSDTNCTTRLSLENKDIQKLNPIKTLFHPISYRKLSNMLGSSDPVLQTDMEGTKQPRPPENQLKDLQLLVAEDNAFNRLLLERFLSYTGAKVTLAPNGERALALAQQQLYDCILMDVHMPLMDGIEASRQIHNLPAPLGDVPIIALTANVISNESEALKKAGVDVTLFKPINETEIIREVQKATGMEQKILTNSLEIKRPRLADYRITEQELMKELNTQITAIKAGYKLQKTALMRDHSHQLTGLAGLLDLVVLEAASSLFNHAVKSKDWKEIWHQLWHLERVINNLDLEED